MSNETRTLAPAPNLTVAVIDEVGECPQWEELKVIGETEGMMVKVVAKGAAAKQLAEKPYGTVFTIDAGKIELVNFVNKEEERVAYFRVLATAITMLDGVEAEQHQPEPQVEEEDGGLPDPDEDLPF